MRRARFFPAGNPFVLMSASTGDESGRSGLSLSPRPSSLFLLLLFFLYHPRAPGRCLFESCWRTGARRPILYFCSLFNQATLPILSYMQFHVITSYVCFFLFLSFVFLSNAQGLREEPATPPYSLLPGGFFPPQIFLVGSRARPSPFSYTRAHAGQSLSYLPSICDDRFSSFFMDPSSLRESFSPSFCS